MERGVVMLTIPRLVELANALACPVEAFIPKTSGSTQSGANEIAVGVITGLVAGPGGMDAGAVPGGLAETSTASPAAPRPAV